MAWLAFAPEIIAGLAEVPEIVGGIADLVEGGIGADVAAGGGAAAAADVAAGEAAAGGLADAASAADAAQPAGAFAEGRGLSALIAENPIFKAVTGGLGFMGVTDIIQNAIGPDAGDTLKRGRDMWNDASDAKDTLTGMKKVLDGDPQQVKSAHETANAITHVRNVMDDLDNSDYSNEEKSARMFEAYSSAVRQINNSNFLQRRAHEDTLLNPNPVVRAAAVNRRADEFGTFLTGSESSDPFSLAGLRHVSNKAKSVFNSNDLLPRGAHFISKHEGIRQILNGKEDHHSKKHKVFHPNPNLHSTSFDKKKDHIGKIRLANGTIDSAVPMSIGSRVALQDLQSLKKMGAQAIGAMNDMGLSISEQFYGNPTLL